MPTRRSARPMPQVVAEARDHMVDDHERRISVLEDTFERAVAKWERLADRLGAWLEAAPLTYLPRAQSDQQHADLAKRIDQLDLKFWGVLVLAIGAMAKAALS